MNELIEFLEEVKTNKKKLAYACTDGWEVIIYDPKIVNENSAKESKLFGTDIYDVLHSLMKHYGLEDQSP